VSVLGEQAQRDRIRKTFMYDLFMAWVTYVFWLFIIFMVPSATYFLCAPKESKQRNVSLREALFCSVFLRRETTLTCPRRSAPNHLVFHTPLHPHRTSTPTAQRPLPPVGDIEVWCIFHF